MKQPGWDVPRVRLVECAMCGDTVAASEAILTEYFNGPICMGCADLCEIGPVQADSNGVI